MRLDRTRILGDSSLRLMLFFVRVDSYSSTCPSLPQRTPF